MTVLYAGGEDTSVTNSGTVQWYSGGLYRSSYCRGCMLVGFGVALSVADPPANRITTPLFTATSSLWTHGQYSNNNNAGNTSGCTLMRLLDASGVARIVVRGTGTAGQMKVEKRNAAGSFTTLATTAAGAISASLNTHAIDLFVNYAVAGQATLYVDGVSVADTGTGVDVTTDSATTLAQADFACLIGSTAGVGWSELLVQTTTTVGAAVYTLTPQATGTTQSWTGAVSDINEAPLSDTTMITTSANNALSEWTVLTTLPSGTWTISAVVQEARVRTAVGAPQHFEWLVRTSDGSNNVTGNVAPTTSFVNYQNVWSVNPHTGAAWAAGELVQAGLESLA